MFSQKFFLFFTLTSFLVVGTVLKYATLPAFQRNMLFPSSWKFLKKISALLISL